jgi:hypothetical protein
MASKVKEIKLSEFQVHIQSCKKCAEVDFEKTNTFSLVCLDGAPLLRDHLSIAARKIAAAKNRALKNQFEDTTRTSKAKLKEVMKYVELAA